MLTSGRNFLHEYASFKREVFADEVTDGEGIEHPFFQLILVYVFWIGNIVEVTANFLTIYHNAELFKDSIAPAIERGTMERLTIAQILAALPLVGKIFM